MVASFPSLRCSCGKKSVSCKEAEGLVTQLWCPRFVTMVVWDCCKPRNTCRDWAFSNSGLEVGLPAFQPPRFAKCDSLPKRDLLDMFVSGIRSHHFFGKCQASTPYQKLKVAESDSTLHQLRIMLALRLEKIPFLCGRFRICVSCRET